jgi:hypothetical protein
MARAENGGIPFERAEGSESTVKIVALWRPCVNTVAVESDPP